MPVPIEQIIEPRKKDLGGFSVRRVLPFHSRKMVGPFIFFDHMGPAEFAPGSGIDVRPHPHIGLATVTYLFDGALAHKDTLGNQIVIRPGAVNWMTAGRGIAHSERTPSDERATGQKMHGIQTWVALPLEYAETEPAFVHHPAATLPAFDLGGAEARMIAGEWRGHASPVEFPWGVWYAAVDAERTGGFEIKADAAEERAVYLVEGAAKVEGEALSPGSMAVLTPGADVSVAVEGDSKLMLAGGQAMDGPRFIDWNFVASTKDRLERAKSDWRASIAGGFDGTYFGQPPGETEWIPLPGDQD